MKRIVFCTIMIIITAKGFCQQIDSSKFSIQEVLLEKSKNQKGAAWVLLVGGSALFIGGLLIGNRNESSFDDAATGAIMGAVGVLSAIGSIPLFLASGRNKRKANAASACLKFEKVPLTLQAGIRFNSYPAACIKINISNK